MMNDLKLLFTVIICALLLVPGISQVRATLYFDSAKDEHQDTTFKGALFEFTGKELTITEYYHQPWGKRDTFPWTYRMVGMTNEDNYCSFIAKDEAGEIQGTLKVNQFSRSAVSLEIIFNYVHTKLYYNSTKL